MAPEGSSALALHTDLYQLTMAAGYFHRGLVDTCATCEMFVRRLPGPRSYLVACGIDQAIAAIADLRFSDDQIDYLRGVPALADAMDESFVDYLRDFRFRGDLWAVPEGTVMFQSEPFVRVEADIIEAQLIETFLLSTINHGTMIASKAARVVQAAQGRAVLEFGTRRTHPASAVDAARAAYLVGAAGTSNVEAGHRFGIPVRGTAAHMWTMTHDSEREAFANYVATFPNASILLVDTYDTVRGAALAAEVAGDKLAGVRLDSGDLVALSKAVRQALDEGGCPQATIVASGDLDEHSIAALLDAGAPIDAFGVGTNLVASLDAPSLGGVYKVVQFDRDGRTVPVAKLSEGKATYPGRHQIHRRIEDGRPVGDVLALASEAPSEGSRALLVPRLRAGVLEGEVGLEDARARAMAELESLPAHLHALEPTGEPYPVALSPGLTSLVESVRAGLT